MSSVEILDISKTYTVGFWRNRLVHALKPLTLQIQDGEIFGILGPNGAGKTTTIRLLMGLVFPTSGTARIFDRDLGNTSVKKDIGFLPEQPYFYDHLTATELLDYYARLSGVAGRERSSKVRTAMGRVGLVGTEGKQLRKFSKGMLQRVGLAQAIVHAPKLLILDEPMSGLDPIGRREVRDLVQELNEEGKTILFSTHILSDAETLCDRVAVLNRGELKGVGVVADLIRDVHGEVEIVWQGAQAIPDLSALGASCHATGETVRALMPERMLQAALDALRKTDARLTSVTPVRATLEDYFLARVGEEKPKEVNA